jgi:hypothetical protein
MHKEQMGKFKVHHNLLAASHTDYWLGIGHIPHVRLRTCHIGSLALEPSVTTYSLAAEKCAVPQGRARIDGLVNRLGLVQTQLLRSSHTGSVSTATNTFT